MPTPNRQYPYPSLAGANDPPRDIQLLAEAVDQDVTALMSASPIAPVYEAGWGEVGAFQGALATRSAAGLVGLSGMVWRTGTTIAATTVGQAVATLPEGYRPAKEIRVYQHGQYANGGNFELGIIQIVPAGTISFGWTTARAWTSGQSFMSLAGFSFVAAS